MIIIMIRVSRGKSSFLTISLGEKNEIITSLLPVYLIEFISDKDVKISF